MRRHRKGSVRVISLRFGKNRFQAPFFIRRVAGCGRGVGQDFMAGSTGATLQIKLIHMRVSNTRIGSRPSVLNALPRPAPRYLPTPSRHGQKIVSARSSMGTVSQPSLCVPRNSFQIAGRVSTVQKGRYRGSIGSSLALHRSAFAGNFNEAGASRARFPRLCRKGTGAISHSFAIDNDHGHAHGKVRAPATDYKNVRL